MKRHWKKLVIAAGVLVVVVIVGSFVYAKLINKADPAFGENDVIDKLNQTTTTVASSAPVATGDTSPSSVDPSTTVAAAGVDGVWNIGADSEVGYRVNEIDQRLQDHRQRPHERHHRFVHDRRHHRHRRATSPST